MAFIKILLGVNLYDKESDVDVQNQKQRIPRQELVE
jgi:hypothetical protein